MVKFDDGSFRYSMESLPWHGFIESPGNLMKVVHVDEEAQQVVFVQRFARNTKHAKHIHQCTAVAYTLSGTWKYDQAEIKQGELAFEPFGTTHTPMTDNDNEADVLVILTSINKDGRLLELINDDGSTFELDLDIFKLMKSLSPEEFLDYQRSSES